MEIYNDHSVHVRFLSDNANWFDSVLSNRSCKTEYLIRETSPTKYNKSLTKVKCDIVT